MRYSTNQAEEASRMTGSGIALPDVFKSVSCSMGFDGSCIRGGGGELPPIGLGLRLGEREGLRFLSRFTGDLRRGDGDLDFRLDRVSISVIHKSNFHPLASI